VYSQHAIFFRLGRRTLVEPGLLVVTDEMDDKLMAATGFMMSGAR
jgi:hypothetical protein